MQEADQELLVRFFHNRCTPEELPRVQELLQQAEAEQFLQQLAQQEWNEPVTENEQTRSLHQQWKAKVNARILSGENAVGQRTGILKKMYRFRHAAVWLGLLLVSAAILWKYTSSKEPQTVAMVQQSNKHGIPVRFILPDSSELYLAAGSTVSYPVSFTGPTREVRLEGEAFFDVRHNPEKPFIIHTGNVDTRVLGTAFRISSIKNRPIEVAVARGKVVVSTANKNLATLTPGNKVTWYAAEQKAVPGKVDANSLTNWRDGELMFDHLSMKHIAEELQKRFGVQIEIIDDSVKDNLVSGTFAANKSIDQVLKALAVAGKFRYESNNRLFRIFQLK